MTKTLTTSINMIFWIFLLVVQSIVGQTLLTEGNAIYEYTQTSLYKFFYIPIDTNTIEKVIITLDVLTWLSGSHFRMILADMSSQPQYATITTTLNNEPWTRSTSEYTDFDCFYSHKKQCSITYNVATSSHVNSGTKNLYIS